MAAKSLKKTIAYLARVVLGLSMIGGLSFLFYGTLVRTVLEDRLKDLRTRIKPASFLGQKIAIIEMKDGQGPDSENFWNYSQLIQLLSKIASQNPASQFLLWQPQVFPYAAKESELLLEYLRQNEKLVVFGFGDTTDKIVGTLSAEYSELRSRILDGGTGRFYRRQVLRTFANPEFAQDSRTVSKFLRNNGNEIAVTKEDPRQLMINYIPKEELEVIDAMALLRGKTSIDLKDRVVFIGYGSYKAPGNGSWESTLVHTPWQTDIAEPEDGSPLVEWHAIVASNLLNNNWLREGSIYVNIAQVVLVSLLGFWAWNLAVWQASAVIIGGSAILLFVHGVLFSRFNFYLPLADSAFWGGLFITVGALRRGQKDARRRAAVSAQASADRQLAVIHGEFLHQFADEMNEVNGAVAAHLRAVESDFAAIPAKQAVFLRALAASEDLHDYLGGISSFVAVGKKRIEIRKENIQLLPLIEKIVRQFEAKRAAEKIDIEVTVDPSLEVLTDPTLCSQILFNLVSNAIKYSPPSGVVEIKVEVSLGNRVNLQVVDHGPGIPSEFQERIFQKFYRIQDDLVHKIKGNGLGLYLSRYFARLIGSDIRVVSEVGHGACFSMILERRVNR